MKKLKRIICWMLAIWIVTISCSYAEETKELLQPILENDALTLEYTGNIIRNEQMNEYMVELYAENKTGKDILLRTIYVNINDIGVKAFIDGKINGLCRNYLYIHIFDTSIERICNLKSFDLEFELQATINSLKQNEKLFDTVLSFNTGYGQTEPELFDFNKYDGTILEYEGEIADIKLGGIRWIESYGMYEVSGFIKNKSEERIYAYAHNINVAGTVMYDQSDYVVDGGGISEIAAYITEDMLYMEPEPDDEISFSFDVIDDNITATETGEYPQIDRASLAFEYNDFLETRQIKES